MITRLLSLVTLTFALTLPAHATDTPAAPPPPAQTQVAPAAKFDYKDAFLQLALDKAKTYSGALESAVSKAVDVTTTETPKLAAEYIRWRFWYHLLHCVVPVVFVLVSGLIALSMRNTPFDDVLCTAPGTVRMVSAVVCAFACLFTFFSLFVDDPPGPHHEQGHVYSLVQVVTAPRIYVIEQVIEIAKR